MMVGRGAGGGAVVQAESPRATRTSDAVKLRRVDCIGLRILMWILILEAVAALFLLVFIVWWTMFSGRDAAERERGHRNAPAPKKNDPPEP
jgi:hypothetical protein